MKLSHARRESAIRIFLVGELGHHEARQTVEYIRSVYLMYPMDRIELDLQGMTFMDSSGLAVMLAAEKESRVRGQALRVYHVPGQAMRVMLAAGLEKKIEFIESEETPYAKNRRK